MSDIIDKILVVIDVQNDFVTGALANEDAQKAIPEIVNLVQKFGDDGCPIIFTKDTHDDDSYLDSQEGKKLPIKHCIRGTHGRDIVKEVYGVIPQDNDAKIIEKCTFGELDIWEYICDIIRSNKKYYHIDNIYICGLCTDICVIINALILKARVPEIEIYVVSDACAGTTPEKHNMALEVMKSCQINVI